MTDGWMDSPPIRDGMRRMLEARAALLAGGDTAIGWKLAFGAPAWLERFAIPGPLVGYLPESLRVDSGDRVSVSGWEAPVAEPEIAVFIGSDVEDPEGVARAISGIAPAIEMANVDPPPGDLEAMLAGNVFHRGVVLGAADPGRAGGDVTGLTAVVTRDGVEEVSTTDLETLTGELLPILEHTARLLHAFGERFRAGEVVIAGSIVPPLQVRPGEEIGFRLDPLPGISVVV